MRAQNFFLIFIFFASFLALNFLFPILPNFPKKEFKLGLDLKGGIRLIYQPDLSFVEEKERGMILAGLRDILERRVNFLGVKEPIIQVKGDKISVELAGIEDPQKAIEEIGKTPFLEFREKKENDYLPTKLTGRYLKSARVEFDELMRPQVSLEFDKEGAKIFEELTEKNLGNEIGIFIDGNLISSPVVKEKISGGRARITGNFTLDEAKNLAENLNAGALPVPIKLASWQFIGPVFGQKSLEKIILAGIFGFATILIFMILFYRFPGLLSCVSLFLYTLFVLALYKIIPVTLTLSGIAGFLLSLGMAIDANILIFSRQREEIKKGREALEAARVGFERAWSAIRDGNLTTLLVALILLFFGESFVQGFATTLSLGILVSFVSNVILTKILLEIFATTKISKIKFLWQ